MANLVFKYSWSHGPYPLNSAQGKQQFMLPFASGIPNLSPAFSQIHDIPSTNPASRVIGTSDGNVMQVGAFGIGATSLPLFSADFDSQKNSRNGFYDTSAAGTNIPDGQLVYTNRGYWIKGIVFPISGAPQLLSGSITSTAFQFYPFLMSGLNTTTDSNGFIKGASPIVKLFASKIELNDDAAKQPIDYEKAGTGDYLLKGSLGFAQEGWYIEVPKDANGNTVVAVEYSMLENGDLSIKTYKRKFDFELAAVVADHENPMDIPEGRWIDIRLHEEPEVISNTPVNFQPTNLSQAVSAALEGIEPPEASDTDETL